MKRCIAAIIFVGVLFLGVKEVQAKVMSPEDEEWKNMTYLEQLTACDYLEEDVKEFDTQTLFDLILEYPFTIDALVYEDINKGLDHLLETSNVYRELFSRDEMKKVLLSQYKDIDVTVFQTRVATDLMIGYLWNKGELTEREKMAIINKRKGNQDTFNTTLPQLVLQHQGRTELVGLSARNSIMQSGYVETDGTQYQHMLFSNEGIYTIVKKGKYYKYGVGVDVLKYISHDYSTSVKNDLNNAFNTAHSNWVYLSTATGKYNCHSFCWINKSYSNIYWMGSPQLYCASASVQHYGTNGPVLENQKVVIVQTDNYGNITDYVHSAVVQTSSVPTGPFAATARVESKFGPYGVYNTSLQDAYVFYHGNRYESYVG